MSERSKSQENESERTGNRWESKYYCSLHTLPFGQFSDSAFGHAAVALGGFAPQQDAPVRKGNQRDLFE